MRILICELIPLLFTQRRFKIDNRLQTSARGRNWRAELQVAAHFNAAICDFCSFHPSFCSCGAAALIELS
jgi:hypothetical protein